MIIQLPDGKRVQFEDGTSVEDAEKQLKNLFPDVYSKYKGFMPALKAGAKGGLAALETTGGEYADRMGLGSLSENLRGRAAQNKQEISDSFQPTTSDEDGIGARARQYLTEPVGEMIGRFGPALGAGAAATMGAAALPITAPIAGAIGTGLGVGLLSGEETGENIDAQKAHGGDVNLLTATAAGLVQGAVDKFGFGKMFAGVAGKVAMKEAESLAPKVLAGMPKEEAIAQLGGTMRNVLSETAGNAVLGTGMNVANEGLRRAQAGESPISDEALAAYKQGAIGAAALAPLFGAMHGAGVKSKAISEHINPAENTFNVNEQARVQREEMYGDPAFGPDRRGRDGQPSEFNPNAADLNPFGVTLPDRRGAAPVVAPPDRRAPDAQAQFNYQDLGMPERRADMQPPPPEPPIEKSSSAPDMDAVNQLAAAAGKEPNITPQLVMPTADLPPAPIVPASPAMTPLGAQIDAARARQNAGELLSPADLGLLRLPSPDALAPAANSPLILPKGAKPNPNAKIETSVPLSTNEDFRGLVAPQAGVWKRNELVGHDLSNPPEIRKVANLLDKYKNDVDGTGKGTVERLEALQSKVDSLRAQADHIEAKQPEPPRLTREGFLGLAPEQQERPAVDKILQGEADVAPPVADKLDSGGNRLPVDGESNGSEQPVPAAPNAAADNGTGGSPVGLRGTREAVPTGVPSAERVPDAAPDRAAGPAISGTQTGGDALAPRVLSDTQGIAKMSADRQAELHAQAGLPPLRAAETPQQPRVVQLPSKLAPVTTEVAANFTEKMKANAARLEAAKAEAAAQAKATNDARLADVKASFLAKTKTPSSRQRENTPKVEAPITKEAPKVEATFDTASRPELGAAVTGGKAVDVGAELAKSKNPVVAQLGHHAESIKGLKIEVSDKVEGKGEYDPKTKTITMHPDFINDEHAVAHEIEHALTQTAIDHPTPQQKPVVHRLNELYNFVKTVLDKDNYGLKSLHEFMAEARGNGEFQRKLAGIKYENTTAWGKFTQYIARLLGLDHNSALTEFLSLHEELGSEGFKVKTDLNAPKLNLIAYANASKTEPKRGLLETISRGVKGDLTSPGAMPSKDVLKQNISDAAYKVEHELFDNKVGVNRLINNNSFTRAVGGKVKASVRALLQHSEYALPMAGDSLSKGYVAVGKEGLVHVHADDHNNLVEAVRAIHELKVADPMAFFRDTWTNLTYHERETASPHDLYPRPKNVTDANIAAAKANMATSPEMQKVASILKAMNMRDIDLQVAAGLKTEAQVAPWRKNQYYVPLQRDMEGKAPLAALSLKGGVTTGKIHKFEGSEREVNDIIGNIIRQRIFVTDAAMRNMAGVESLHALANIPAAGTHLLPGRPNDMANVVHVKENGADKFYRVTDKMAYSTLHGMVEQVPQFMRAFEKITQVLREGIMLSPGAMARNMIRDVSESAGYSYTKRNMASTAADVVKNYVGAVPSIFRQMKGGEMHRPHYEIQSYGISGQQEATSTHREMNRLIRESMKGADASNWAGYADSFVGALHNAWQQLASEGELATRDAVYKQVLEKTGSTTEAALASINTLDFRRRGAHIGITYAKMLIPFFNSNLQGMYKLYRTIARNDSQGAPVASARAALVARGTAMMLASSLWQAYLNDDEDYKQLPKEQTDNKFVIPMGNGSFATMPIPFELGTLFYTIPSNVVRLAWGDSDGKEFKSAMVQALKQNMPANGSLMGLVTGPMKPIAEHISNYDSFTSKPIESDTMKKQDASLRVRESTTGVAKLLGGDIMSPVQIDHFVQGYLGTLGIAALNVTDSILDAAGVSSGQPGVSSPEQTTSKALAKYTGLNFVSDPLQSRYVNRFYELRDQGDEVANTVNKLKSEGREAELTRYLQDMGPNGVQNLQMLSLHTPMASIAKQLATLRTAEEMIANRPDSELNPIQKRQQIEALKRQGNAMVKQAMPSLNPIAGRQ